MVPPSGGHRKITDFWATVCKTVRRILLDRCLSVCLSCPVCLSRWCIVTIGQTAEWIKMPFGTELGLGPGHIVLDGDPALTL